MALSLKKVNYAFYLFVVLVLGLLLAFGIRQYQLHHQYQKIIEQNEKIIFQFSTIREHVTESLLEGRYAQLKDVVGEVESLNNNISKTLQSELIPGQYKIAFVNQVDLAGIILLMRSLAVGNVEQAKIRHLNEEVRILGDRLMLFDRIIVNHVKKKLVGFQSIVIGVLAIVLFLVVNILILWQRWVAVPLFDLAGQVKELSAGKRNRIKVAPREGEIRDLADAVQSLSATRGRLAEKLAVYTHIFEVDNDLIMVLTHEGLILDANPTAVELIGKGLDAIAGKSIFDTFEVDLKAAPPHPLVAAIKNGSGDVEADIKRLGGEYFITISTFPVSQDFSGKRLLMVAKDISGDKASVVKATKISRMAAIGDLAMGVAHEINNLSNGLINYSQILSEEIEEASGDENQLELLGNIINEGERIAHVVQQLLFFNQNRSQLVEPVRIEKVVEETISLIRHQLKSDGISVVTEFADLPKVALNVQKMQHVFLNLLSNARHSLNLRYSRQHDDKILEVKSESIRLDGRDWLQIRFTDKGTGIDPGIINKVFDPFFSAKDEGEGTGLGLSICRDLVRENSGDIQIESVPNDHTTVIVILPIS